MTTKRVPIVPTKEQWSGLARRIIMAWDMGCDTPRKMFAHLEFACVKIPDWMRIEQEMQNLDHVPSKGTRAALIYRAMIEDFVSDGKQEHGAEFKVQAELLLKQFDVPYRTPEYMTDLFVNTRNFLESFVESSDPAPVAMLVIQPDGHETLMKYSKAGADAFINMKCKVVLLGETKDDQVKYPKDENAGFDDFFDRRIDVLAEKHPALLVRQLAQLVRKQRNTNKN